jgi:hypothetical protein
MIRSLVYGFTGLLIGAFLGLVIFSFNTSWNFFAATVIGGIFGLVLGIVIAAIFNERGVLDRPFVTQQDIDSLQPFVERKFGPFQALLDLFSGGDEQ